MVVTDLVQENPVQRTGINTQRISKEDEWITKKKTGKGPEYLRTNLRKEFGVERKTGPGGLKNLGKDLTCRCSDPFPREISSYALEVSSSRKIINRHGQTSYRGPVIRPCDTAL